tara:strand:- start:1573 stop:3588 length:2016 start_codon:yes stop_codon:yes gene_type:complete
MGAYENPNINIGVDTESNQLINRAFASFGQSIAQGVEGANKIAIQQREKEEKNRLEALQRSIGIIDELDEDSITADVKNPVGGDLGSAVNLAAFSETTEVGDDGEEIGTTSAMSNVLEATQTGTATPEQILKNNQWQRFIPKTKEIVENVTAAGDYVNNLEVGKIYTPGSSSGLLSFLNGEFNDADTNVIYNKRNGFSYLTKAEGGVMANIGNGKFDFNWNEANAGLVKSMNDKDLYHMGFGKHDIITIPPLQELSYEAFVGNPAKGEGAIIKPNSSGTARFYNQALYVEEEIITGVDLEGTYTQVIKKPNVENLEALAIETANARIDGHLTTGPNSYKSLNAYVDNYFNPEVGPGRGTSALEFWAANHPGLTDDEIKRAVKTGYHADLQDMMNRGVVGYIEDPTYEGSGLRTVKNGGYIEIAKLTPVNPAAFPSSEAFTKLPGDLLFLTRNIDAMKQMMSVINNKILGTYDEPDDATATPKDRTYKSKFPNITPSLTDNSNAQFKTKFNSLNKPVVDEGKNQGYNQFDSNNKNIDYTQPNTGAPGLLNAIINDPALTKYKSVITDNYLPMVSGGKAQTAAHKKITDNYAAIIGLQHGVTKNTPLALFPVGIKLLVAEAAEEDIAEFDKKLDKGLVWNLNKSGRAPGKAITTEELILQLPARFTTVQKYEN